MKTSFLKSLPSDITSYDVLKTIAVLTMIIDHIGMYFYPEQIEWRIIGRMSMPIWLFLIGYANSREIPSILLAGGVVLLIANIVVGQPIFSLNILFTIMAVRLVLDAVMSFLLSSPQQMFLGLFAMALVVFPTLFLVDYGTQALLFAVFGYMVRHQAKIGFSNELIIGIMTAIFMIYILFQKITFGMNNAEFFTMGAGVLFVCLILSMFKMEVYSEWTRKLPKVVTGAIQLMGRRTLEIYVIHLLLFKVAGLALYPDRFSLFNLELF